MAATIYHSVAPADPAAAQATVTSHAAGLDGWCPVCAVPGPCLPYVVATSALRGFGLFPHRVPGVTRPDLLGRRQAPSGWLTPGPADLTAEPAAAVGWCS